MRYRDAMRALFVIIALVLWLAANVWLWSLKQAPVALFWQALGMAAIGFPALFWHVTRPQK